MRLTEVRIKLCGRPTSRLKAFCSLTFDSVFVIRDAKLIDGNNGVFLAMPSRKLSDHCSRCGEKNHLRAQFCNQCGLRLDENRHLRHAGGNGAGNGPNRLKLHADVAHPITVQFRQELERRVIAAYFAEIERSKQPGYIPPSLDAEDFDAYDLAVLPPQTPERQIAAVLH